LHEHLIKQASHSPDFIVLTSDEFKEEARDFFRKKAKVYTIPEDKGQHHEYVVLYKLLSSSQYKKALQRINNALKADPILDEQGNRIKKKYTNRTSRHVLSEIILNLLITACGRSKRNIIFCEENLHYYSEIYKYIKTFITPNLCLDNIMIHTEVDQRKWYDELVNLIIGEATGEIKAQTMLSSEIFFNGHKQYFNGTYEYLKNKIVKKYNLTTHAIVSEAILPSFHEQPIMTVENKIKNNSDKKYVEQFVNAKIITKIMLAELFSKPNVTELLFDKDIFSYLMSKANCAEMFINFLKTKKEDIPTFFHLLQLMASPYPSNKTKKGLELILKALTVSELYRLLECVSVEKEELFKQVNALVSKDTRITQNQLEQLKKAIQCDCILLLDKLDVSSLPHQQWIELLKYAVQQDKINSFTKLLDNKTFKLSEKEMGLIKKNTKNKKIHDLLNQMCGFIAAPIINKEPIEITNQSDGMDRKLNNKLQGLEINKKNIVRLLQDEDVEETFFDAIVGVAVIEKSKRGKRKKTIAQGIFIEVLCKNTAYLQILIACLNERDNESGLLYISYLFRKIYERGSKNNIKRNHFLDKCDLRQVMEWYDDALLCCNKEFCNYLRYNIFSRLLRIHHNENGLYLYAIAAAIELNNPRLVDNFLSITDADQKDNSLYDHAIQAKLCLLHQAIDVQNLEILVSLLENKNIDRSVRYNNLTPLQHAVNLGRIEMVDYMLSLYHPASISLANQSLVDLAINRKDFDMLAILLKRGIKPSSKANGFFPSLHKAIALGCEDSIIHLLLDHIDLLEINELVGLPSQKSALHLAIEGNDYFIVDLLLEKGADPNLLTSEKDTPLCMAINFKSLTLFDLLLQHGANPAQVNHQGLTPLDLAIVNQQVEICQSILNKNIYDEHSFKDKSITPLLLAILKGNREIIVLILSHFKSQMNFTVSINEQHCQILLNKMKTGKSLCSYIAKNAGAEALSSLTPLHVAILFSDDAVVSCLLDQGAKLDVPASISIHTLLTHLMKMDLKRFRTMQVRIEKMQAQQAGLAMGHGSLLIAPILANQGMFAHSVNIVNDGNLISEDKQSLAITCPQNK
ncbi:MAG: ankyrin repeat domain-containing protein, partial [Gammaproteobacteria bacterium]|nr:ankyrin repeat domain-containing protein [Gammaproteobacteria bacterium]